MIYDKKEIKAWKKVWVPDAPILNMSPGEAGLYSLVQDLFTEMQNTHPGEIFMRQWPTLERSADGSYRLSTRLAAIGWLEDAEPK